MIWIVGFLIWVLVTAGIAAIINNQDYGMALLYALGFEAFFGSLSGLIFWFSYLVAHPA